MTDLHGTLFDVAASDEQLLARIREGDEAAFESLVTRYHRPMLAVARAHVRGAAVAEEVVQEAWLGVLRGLHRFEERSSLKTWVLRIVANIAMTKGAREARSVPFSALDPGEEGPAVDPDRFQGAAGEHPGEWVAGRTPSDWTELPETVLAGRETVQLVTEAIAALPDAQRTVIALRDIHGYSSEEVCEALDVTPGNQRVLLHRARSHIRRALERHLDD
jgi:RNA polymerase sigma-70 factor, ECF subfamily